MPVFFLTVPVVCGQEFQRKHLFLLDHTGSVGYTYGVASEKRFSEVQRILEKKGYHLVRIMGSHHIFEKPGAPLCSVPVHKRKVKPTYVRQIEKL